MSDLPDQKTVSRRRTIGLQAIGVVLIAAFVFIAFLRPSEPDRLSGIAAPGDTPSVKKGNPPDGDKKDKMKRARPGGPGSGPRSGSAPGGTGGGTSSASTASDVGVTAPGGGPPGGGDTDDEDPLSSQYDSLPDLLMAEVGNPAIFRGIEP